MLPTDRLCLLCPARLWCKVIYLSNILRGQYVAYVFTELVISSPLLDADARSGCRGASDVPPPHLHHQLKGRHPLQLGEGTHQRHLLIHTEASQAHDHHHYYYYYYYYYDDDDNYNSYYSFCPSFPLNAP